jgi:hypothetical protein
MELKDLLEKAQARTITKEEVFQYYGVTNLEGLESVLALKFDNPKETLSFLDGSLDFIYTARKKKDYSPIEENYMLYGICAQGIYGVSMDEISILNGYFGAFRVLMILDAILKDKPEILFFKKLYKEYIERKENIVYTLTEGVQQLLDFAIKNLGNLDEGKLNSMINDFQKTAGDLFKDKQ